MPVLKSVPSRRHQVHSDGPSLTKKSKIIIPRICQPTSRSMTRSRANAATNLLPPTLCDLPSDIIEKIIGNINIWHHNRIRATSRRLKEISDNFIMHEFRKALADHVSVDPCSYESAVLKTIQQATEVYVNSGFRSLFCGCLLPMLRSCYKNPFCPQQHQINKFFLHFFDMVEYAMGDSTSQTSRLLYNLTLMRFFKAFSTFSILNSCSLPLHWRTVIELRGPWLGMLWKSKKQTPNHFCKQNHLLVILSELLIANISEKAFKRVWECGSEIYVYGSDTTNDKRTPKTLFIITVHGSKKISSLLSSCLDVEPSSFVWPNKWPRDQFTVNVDINCKEATKWGCSKSQHLEFSPFAEQTFSDEDGGSKHSSESFLSENI